VSPMCSDTFVTHVLGCTPQTPRFPRPEQGSILHGSVPVHVHGHDHGSVNVNVNVNVNDHGLVGLDIFGL
jgi:hypothetical protein